MQRFPTQWFGRTSGEGHKLGCIKARESCRFLPFSSYRRTKDRLLFVLLLAFFAGAFLTTAFAAGLEACFRAWCSALARLGFDFDSGLAGASDGDGGVAAVAAFAFPLATSAFLPTIAAAGTAPVAALAAPDFSHAAPRPAANAID